MADRPRKKNPLIHSLTITVIMCIVTFFCLVFSIVVLVRFSRLKDRAASLEESLAAEESESILLTPEEAQKMVERASDSGVQMGREAVLKELRTALQNRNDFLPVIRHLYKDELMIYDGGVYRFAALNKNLEMSRYDPGDFYTGGSSNPVYSGRNGKASYGADISGDTAIDSWEELSKGKSFVIISIGYKDASEGKVVFDRDFEKNLKEAKKHGLSIGVSFRSGAADPDEARAEAEAVLKKLEGFRDDITYPVVVIPGKDFASGRGDRSLSTAIFRSFSEKVRESGYVPMIGGDISEFVLEMDLAGLEDIDKYVVDHGIKPYYPYRYSIWQYGGGEKDENGNTTPGLDIGFYE